MINAQYDEQIKKWIEDNKSWIIDEWIELCKIPSIKSESKEGAPYGEECARALENSAELFSKKGFFAKVYKESGYALAKYPQSEKTIGLFSHCDVVPVGEGWIFTSPFEPIIKDSHTLIGRGVEDNKSGIMLSLAVMMMARDLNLPIKSTLQAFIGSNEESGMEDIKAFAKEQVMPDISLVPDGTFPCSAGEKGIYHYWARSQEKLQKIKDFSGGEAFNVVLDKVEVTLENNEDIRAEIISKISGDDRFSLLENGVGLVLLVKGIAKHASVPEGSENAAYLAAEILKDCNSLSKVDRSLMKKVSRLTKSSFGEGIDLCFQDEFFGKLTMVNGMVRCENSQVMLSFDTRYGNIDAKEVEERTKKGFFELDFEVKEIENSSGFHLEDDKILKKLVEIYNEITQKDAKVFYMSGGTYARYLKDAISVGTFDGRPNNFPMPKGHGEAHQCDEMIDLDGFFEAVRIIMHYIIEIDKM